MHNTATCCNMAHGHKNCVQLVFHKNRIPEKAPRAASQPSRRTENSPNSSELTSWRLSKRQSWIQTFDFARLPHRIKENQSQYSLYISWMICIYLLDSIGMQPITTWPCEECKQIPTSGKAQGDAFGRLCISSDGSREGLIAWDFGHRKRTIPCSPQSEHLNTMDTSEHLQNSHVQNDQACGWKMVVESSLFVKLTAQPQLPPFWFFCLPKSYHATITIVDGSFSLDHGSRQEHVPRSTLTKRLNFFCRFVSTSGMFLPCWSQLPLWTWNSEARIAKAATQHPTSQTSKWMDSIAP